MKAFYSPHYGEKIKECSMRKLSMVAKQVEHRNLATLVEPQVVALVADKLRTLHNPDYVESFLRGQMPLAGSNGIQWTKNVREAVLWSNAGLLESAFNALETGLSANIGQGYHHSVYGRGDAFCTFNGLALVAQEIPKKIFVLDCDTHQGNGTKEFTAQLENLYNYSIFSVSFDNNDALDRAWDRQVRSWWEWEAALQEALLIIDTLRPDLIIYQAGMDAYEKDTTGGILSKAELAERDRLVFEYARDSQTPITFVMAGGYTEEAVDLHVKTFEIVLDIYS